MGEPDAYVTGAKHAVVLWVVSNTGWDAEQSPPVGLGYHEHARESHDRTSAQALTRMMKGMGVGTGASA